MNKYILISLFGLALGTSCFKKDKPYTLPLSTGTTIVSLSLGPTYARSYFFDLDSKDSLRFDNNAWDMAFQCATDSFHIFINGENTELLLNKGVVDFSSISYHDTLGIFNYPSPWLFDAPSWRSDSTAFGTWYDAAGNSKHQVFILYRGGGTMSKGARYRKLMVDKAPGGNYKVTFANIDGTDQHTITIAKNVSKNLIYANLADSGKVLDLDQNKMDYDLQFTRYRYVYYNLRPMVLYYVTGAMINVPYTWVAIDSSGIFDKLNKLNFNPAAYSYSNARDVIGGLGWKKYNFSTAKYEVKPNYVYIIKNKANHYFKLHFVDYYDAGGNRGTPRFEYERIR